MLLRRHVFAQHAALERRQGVLYWSLVENRRVRHGRVVQHTELYLGETNDSQKEQWIRAIEVFDEDGGGLRQLKLFAAERGLPAAAAEGVRVCLRQFRLHRLSECGCTTIMYAAPARRQLT